MFKEDKQNTLNAICEALRTTAAAGSPQNNPLVELRYIQKENGDEVARPIFADGGGENGWYDVNISGDSCIAIFIDVCRQFVTKVW